MSPDRTLTPKGIADLAHVVLEFDSVEAVLDGLVSSVAHTLHLTGSAVSLTQGGRLEFATSAPPHLGSAERAQQAGQAGPAVCACRTGQTVTITHLPEHADDWPLYCAAAEHLGVHAVAAVPMRLDAEPVGALDLYRSHPHTWSDEELVNALVAGQLATGYLLAVTLRQQRRLCDQLRQALQSRQVIEQAKGILAATQNIDPEAAYQRIRRHARSHHTNVHAVAQAIVGLGLRP